MEDRRRLNVEGAEVLIRAVGHLVDRELHRKVIDVHRKEGVVHAMPSRSFIERDCLGPMMRIRLFGSYAGRKNGMPWMWSQ